MEHLPTSRYIEVVNAVLRRETMIAYRRLQEREGQQVFPMPPPSKSYLPALLSPSIVADCAYAANVIAEAIVSPIWSDMDAARSFIEHQKQMTKALSTVRRQFKQNAPQSAQRKQKPSWRRLETNFRETPASDGSVLNGTPTFAPAWYPVGSKTGREPPTSSATLTNENKECGYQFLDEIKSTTALIMAIVGVIHPAQCEIGLSTNSRLADQDEGLKNVFTHWPSCFSAVQVISNRVSPVHLDVGASYGSFDVLATVGKFSGGHIQFPTLSIDVDQRAGSVVAFAAHLLPHSVAEFEGDRVSFAWFLKDAVGSWAGMEPVPWCKTEDVNNVLATA
ncbi:hypothetical protein EVJ58_g8649 [Rhodofomes roseus]|uniref:2OGFeDO JBP1/TET oxygenase domain-containing protein n=1 Tax=Rhodofomes roseus TaxID=34475 RepID=A0A4Y9Y1P4_9APHY|nr:hypothetical protein EVJ58_g8649 [Rhodofomes roseus]